METKERIQKTKEQLQALRYELIDLEQVLILLISLEVKNKEVEHL